MSGVDPRRYQPCVEDWDEEAEAPLPASASRITATVAARDTFDPISPVIRYANDGTDSGYASQAPTISSRASMASSHRRRESNPPNIVERERKPYAMTATPREPDRSSTMPKPDTKEPKPLKKPPFCHQRGICWVCDQHGFHFDPKDLPKKETSKPATPSQPSVPTPQPKRETPKPKLEEAPMKLTRRMSTNQSRPQSMYAAPPVQPPFQYATMPPQAWPTSTPPPPPQQQQPQYSYYMQPTTPIYTMPPSQQPPNYYYEQIQPQPVYEEYQQPPPQPKPSRRTSMINAERPKLEKRPSRTHTMMERPVFQEPRPQIVTHKSTRSIDVDRAAMPPPPKPSHATINTSRPRSSRSNTYHSNTSSNRHSYYEEGSDEEYIVGPRGMAAYKEPPSPSRPPSSYRQMPAQEAVERSRVPHQDVLERPRLQEKANSYQQGSNTVHVASNRGVPRRRTTESAPPPKTAEQNATDAAEAYMRKRGSFPVNDLTAENLKNLKTVATRQVSDQRSESGSTGSHLTHHSSSKDSSNGRGRAGVSNGSVLSHAPKTGVNISVGGLNLSITDGGSINGDGPPVKIDFGAIQLHMNSNNRDKENIDYRPRPPKQLERAPSMSSQPSRRSLTSSSLVPSGSQRREEQLAIEAPNSRDPRAEYTRRPSYVDEDEREAIRRSAKSSRQASRNTSHTRQPHYEEMPMRPRPNRSSVDYSVRQEPVM